MIGISETRDLAGPGFRRGSVRVWGTIFGLCALAFLNTDFVVVRKLCNTAFDYPDFGSHWEEIFRRVNFYVGAGERSLIPMEPNTIGYFLTLTSCPDDGYPGADSNDPRK